MNILGWPETTADLSVAFPGDWDRQPGEPLEYCFAKLWSGLPCYAHQAPGSLYCRRHARMLERALAKQKEAQHG